MSKFLQLAQYLWVKMGAQLKPVQALLANIRLAEKHLSLIWRSFNDTKIDTIKKSYTLTTSPFKSTHFLNSYYKMSMLRTHQLSSFCEVESRNVDWVVPGVVGGGEQRRDRLAPHQRLAHVKVPSIQPSVCRDNGHPKDRIRFKDRTHPNKNVCITCLGRSNTNWNEPNCHSK